MAEFAPPTGPPPPRVPEGWKAVWNDQYSEYFYVNIYTKKSQWDKPDEPVYPPGEFPPDGPPPPSYAASDAQHTPASEKSHLSSNNPYASTRGAPPGAHDISEDERLARQLQEEEQARMGGNGPPLNRGASDTFYNNGGPQGPPQQQAHGPPSQAQNLWPPAGSPMYPSQNKSFLGKIFGGGKSGSSGPQGPPQQPHSPQPGPPQHYGHSPQPYPPQGYPPQGYGHPPQGYPPQGYPHQGYPPQGYPPQGYPPHGYSPQPMPMYAQQQRPGKRPGGGGMGAMGMAGGAALGLGGGMLLGSALAGDDGDTYNYYGDSDGGGDDGGDFDDGGD